MKQHPFEPTVITVRRVGNDTIRSSRCRLCSKPGRQYARQSKGRVTVYWQHKERPEVEPVALEACDYEGMGNIWCCRAKDHAGSHHLHRGPRRNVHD